MKRRAASLALAAVIALIALSLLSGAAAADNGGSNGAPKSLTHRFPLGSQTLTHPKTAPARGSATTPSGGSATTPSRASATTPGRGSATTPQRNSATAPHGATATPPRHGTTPATRHHTHGGIPSLALLALIPVLIAVALLGRAVIRRSRRSGPPGRPDDRVSRGPARFTRSGGGTRWADVGKTEVEHKPPPLPVRRRPK